MRKIQKEIVSNATNTDFFNLFFKSQSVTKLIGYFGQIISGATEFHFIYSGVGGVYTPIIKWSNLLPVLLGLLVIYIFEVVGVRVFLVRIVRQIANRKFETSESMILFGFNLLFVLVLCGSNLLFSIIGQKASFTTLTNVTTTDNTYLLELEKTAKVEDVNLRYNDRKKELITPYETDKQTIINSYDNDIKELKNSRYTHRENKPKYDSYTSKIDTKLTAKANGLSGLTETFSNDKKQLEIDRKNEISNITKGLNKRIKDIEKTEKGNVSLWVMVQKYTLPILVVFILLSWVAIIYIEVFYKGSGQDIEVKEISSRPLLLWVLIVGLYDKFYHWFYGKVVNKIGLEKYRYTEIRNNEIEVKPIELMNPQTLAAMQNNNNLSVRKIGFNRSEKNDTNNNPPINNGNVTNYQNTPFNAPMDHQQSPFNAPMDHQQSPLNGERITVNVAELKDNQKKCKHCTNIFTYKHWNAKYCSDDCRIKSWELRTGKTFTKKSKS
jgi:hypothetical protein